MHSLKTVVADTGSVKLSVSETWNEADYKAYRRFDTDSSISFGSETNPKQ
jgi:hypothetical protein